MLTQPTRWRASSEYYTFALSNTVARSYIQRFGYDCLPSSHKWSDTTENDEERDMYKFILNETEVEIERFIISAQFSLIDNSS